jgi:histidinol-phosphate aminotransferase
VTLPPHMTPRLRPELSDIPAYRPGRPPTAKPGVTAFKLSSNENPYPPLPSVVSAVAEAAAQLNRYPDMFATGLVAAIAERFDVPVGHVATGTGSVGVFQQILQAVVSPGDEVVYPWRSFEAYPVLARVVGARSVQVPLTRGFGHDLAAMAEAITERTRAVMVCTPNNPTGTAVARAELTAFLDRVPADCLVVLDEAYREFVDDPAVPDGLDVYRDRPNVTVLRTFSKAYGLAGLRVGFAVAHSPVAQAVRKTAVPFGVSGVAQAAAVASLAAESELQARVNALIAERHRVTDALAGQGWLVPPSQANFVWLPLGAATEDFARDCEAAGVSVRPFPGEGARVTIGETEANDVMLGVASHHLP